MSDRVDALVVLLDAPLDEDEAAQLAQAIGQMRHVLEVLHHTRTAASITAEVVAVGRARARVVEGLTALAREFMQP